MNNKVRNKIYNAIEETLKEMVKDNEISKLHVENIPIHTMYMLTRTYICKLARKSIAGEDLI